MRRWLSILLLFLLPLQSSWAMSAAYCQHEQERGTQSRHWGHHEHAKANGQAGDRVHDGDGVQKNAGSQPNPVFAGDCALCHLGHAQHAAAEPAGEQGAAPGPQAPRPLGAEPFDSHIPDVPLRPARALAA